MNRRNFFKALVAAPLAILKLPKSLVALLEEEIISIPSFIDEDDLVDSSDSMTRNDEGIVTHMALGPFESGYYYWTENGGTTWEKVYP